MGAPFTSWRNCFSNRHPVFINISALLLIAIIVTTCGILSAKIYYITIETSPPIAGSTSMKSGEYRANEQLEIEAVPKTGWLFVEWKGDKTSTNPLISITVDKDMHLTADFVEIMHDLTVTITGNGTISKTVIDAPQKQFQEGTLVELTAVPDPEWTLVKWEGDIDGNNPDEESIQVLITTDRTIQAHFRRIEKFRNFRIVYAGYNRIRVDVQFYSDKTSTFIDEVICYSTHSDPGLDDTCLPAKSAGWNAIYADSDDFEAETRYYFRALASTGEEIHMSDVLAVNTFRKYYEEGGGVTDTSGNTYRTIILGDQEWMAENLNARHYATGEMIRQIRDHDEWLRTQSSAWSFYENNSEYGRLYGRLYNGRAVTDRRNICPEGWKVPSDDDWMQLEEYLGMPDYELGPRDPFDDRGVSSQIGVKLKTMDTSVWRSSRSITGNASGFSALPAGVRYSDGFISTFTGEGSSTTFWTSTVVEHHNAMFARSLSGSYEGIGGFVRPFGSGMSVRCIRE